MEWLRGISDYVAKQSIISVLNSSLSIYLKRSPITSDQVEFSTERGVSLVVRDLELQLRPGAELLQIKHLNLSAGVAAVGHVASAKVVVRGVVLTTVMQRPSVRRALSNRDSAAPYGPVHPQVPQLSHWGRATGILRAMESLAGRFATDLEVEVFDVRVQLDFPKGTDPRASQAHTKASPSVASRRSMATGGATCASVSQPIASGVQLRVDRIRALVSQHGGQPHAEDLGASVLEESGQWQVPSAGDRYSWAGTAGGVLERTIACFGVSLGLLVDATDGGGSAEVIPLLCFAGDSRVHRMEPAGRTASHASHAQQDATGPTRSRHEGEELSESGATASAGVTPGGAMPWQTNDSTSGLDSAGYFAGAAWQGGSGVFGSGGVLGGHLQQGAGGGLAMAGDAAAGAIGEHSLNSGGTPSLQRADASWDTHLLSVDVAPLKVKVQLHAAPRPSGSTAGRKMRIDAHVQAGGLRVLMSPSRLRGLAPLVALLMVPAPVASGTFADAICPSVARTSSARVPAAGGTDKKDGASVSSDDEAVVERILLTAAGVKPEAGSIAADGAAHLPAVSPEPAKPSGLREDTGTVTGGFVQTLGWLVGLSNAPSGRATLSPEGSDSAASAVGRDVGAVDAGANEEGVGSNSMFSFAARPVVTRGLEPQGKMGPGKGQDGPRGDDTMTSFMSFQSSGSSFVQSATEQQEKSSLRKSKVVEQSMQASRLAERSSQIILRLDAAVRYVQVQLFDCEPSGPTSENAKALVLSLGNLRTKQAEALELATFGVMLEYVQLDSELRSPWDGDLTLASTSDGSDEATDSDAASSAANEMDDAVPLGGIAPTVKGVQDAAIMQFAALRGSKSDESGASIDVELGDISLRVPTSSLHVLLCNGYHAALEAVSNEVDHELDMQWQSISDVISGAVPVLYLPAGADPSSAGKRYPGLALVEIKPPHVSIAASKLSLSIAGDSPGNSSLCINVGAVNVRNDALGVCIPSNHADKLPAVDSLIGWRRFVRGVSVPSMWTIDGMQWSLHAVGEDAGTRELLRLDGVKGSGQNPGVLVCSLPAPLHTALRDNDSSDSTGDQSFESRVLRGCSGFPQLRAVSSVGVSKPAKYVDGMADHQQAYQFCASMVRVDLCSAQLFLDQVQQSDSQAITSLMQALTPRASDLVHDEPEDAQEPVEVEETNGSALTVIAASSLAIAWKEINAVELQQPVVEILAASSLEEPTPSGHRLGTATSVSVAGCNLATMETIAAVRSDKIGLLVAAFSPHSGSEPEEMGHNNTPAVASPGVYVAGTDAAGSAEPATDPGVAPVSGTASLLSVNVAHIKHLYATKGDGTLFLGMVKSPSFQAEWLPGRPGALRLECPGITCRLSSDPGLGDILNVEDIQCVYGAAAAEEAPVRVAHTADLRDSLCETAADIRIGQVSCSLVPAVVKQTLLVLRDQGVIPPPEKLRQPLGGSLGHAAAAAPASRPQHVAVQPTLTELRPTLLLHDGLTTRSGGISSLPSAKLPAQSVHSEAEIRSRLKRALARSDRFGMDSSFAASIESVDASEDASKGRSKVQDHPQVVIDDFFSDAYASLGTFDVEDGASVTTEAVSSSAASPTGDGNLLMSVMIDGESGSSPQQVDILQSSIEEVKGGIASAEVIGDFFTSSEDLSLPGKPRATGTQPSTNDGTVFQWIFSHCTKFKTKMRGRIGSVVLAIQCRPGGRAFRAELQSCGIVGFVGRAMADRPDRPQPEKVQTWCASVGEVSLRSVTRGAPDRQLLSQQRLHPGVHSTQAALRVATASLGALSGISVALAPLAVNATLQDILLGEDIAAAFVAVLPATAPASARAEPLDSLSIQSGSIASSRQRYLQIYCRNTSVTFSYVPGTTVERTEGPHLLPDGLVSVLEALKVEDLRLPLSFVDWRDDRMGDILASCGRTSSGAGIDPDEADAPLGVLGLDGVSAVVLQAWQRAVTAKQILSAAGALQHPLVPFQSVARIGGAVKKLALLPIDGAAVAARGAGRMARRMAAAGSRNSAVAQVRLSNRRRRGGGALHWSRKLGHAVVGLGRALAVEALRATSSAAGALHSGAGAAEGTLHEADGDPGATTATNIGLRPEKVAGAGSEGGEQIVLAIPVEGPGDVSSGGGTSRERGLGRVVTRALPVAVLRATAEVSGAVRELSDALRRSLVASGDLDDPGWSDDEEDG